MFVNIVDSNQIVNYIDVESCHSRSQISPNIGNGDDIGAVPTASAVSATSTRRENKSMKLRLALIFMFASTAFAADGVSFVNEGVVDAPLGEIWKVFTTSEGYKILGVAQAEVDFRIGGTIRSRYSANGPLGDDETIENQILAYEPPSMIATRIQKTPKGFPFKESWKHSWTVVTLTAVDDKRTRVRVASLGFGTDTESLAMGKFFETGNQVTIESLQKHFAKAGAQ
jgi:uncharacterized protein YndB with AHSA1/START domain